MTNRSPSDSRSGDEAETIVVGGAQAGPAKSSEAADGGLGKGSRVGRYVLLEKIGEGGMGIVVRAYDPKLRREVALKLMRVGSALGRPKAEALMLREAQALARLSDPHVVAVYDAEITEHGVCIAMEYVEGRTLRVWLDERPRRWQEVLEVVLAMARGLAAAHAADVVHRDVKPANVLIRRDGRVRLTDFGIAHAQEGVRSSADAPTGLGGDEPSSNEGAQGPSLRDDGAELTQDGMVFGTPAYMAPEQHDGRGTDARSDQYALCVVSWEALYGERPFRGDTPEALQRAKLQGPPPRPSFAVPAWVHEVLARGLACDPQKRWPSMEALVEALSSGRVRARRRRVVMGAMSLACVVGSALAWQQWKEKSRIEACGREGEAIAEVWNENVRENLRQALVNTGVSHADVTAQKVMPWLDAQAAAWQSARTDACLETEVHGRWDEDLHDRAKWCLLERRLELEALVQELSRGEAQVVREAVVAAAGLTRVDGCRQSDLLARLPMPPRDQEQEVTRLRAELSRARALQQTGAYAEGIAVARDALAHATVLDWPPLTAAVRLCLGGLFESTGAYVDAEEAMEAAYFEAASAGATELAISAAEQLVFLVGHKLARHADGLRWSRLAEVGLAILPDVAGMRVAAHLDKLASVHHAKGRYEEARTLYERALVISEKALGAEHPAVAQSLNNLAGVHWAAGGYEEAKRLHQRALTIGEQTLGSDHPFVAMSLHDLAGVHLALGRHDEAKAHYERALDIWKRAAGPDHPHVARVLVGLAHVALEQGLAADAVVVAERAMRIREHADVPTEDLADARFVLARATMDAGGDPAFALALAEAARDAWRDTGRNADEVAEVDAWLADRVRTQ